MALCTDEKSKQHNECLINYTCCFKGNPHLHDTLIMSRPEEPGSLEITFRTMSPFALIHYSIHLH